MLNALVYRLALLLAYLSLVVAQATFTPAFTNIVLPAVQTSVSSTAFNPAIQNAGGTTNSAGTFNVVSLSQSTSVPYDSNIPITTSFVISPAPFAASGDIVTPSYFTQQPAASPSYENPATTSQVSLPTSLSAVVSALTTVASDAAVMDFHVNGMWTILLSASAAIIGAVLVL